MAWYGGIMAVTLIVTNLAISIFLNSGLRLRGYKLALNTGSDSAAVEEEAIFEQGYSAG